jgi:hypothetical protein
VKTINVTVESSEQTYPTACWLERVRIGTWTEEHWQRRLFEYRGAEIRRDMVNAWRRKAGAL